jgi:hypothetical protein
LQVLLRVFRLEDTFNALRVLDAGGSDKILPHVDVSLPRLPLLLLISHICLIFISAFLTRVLLLIET